MKNERRRKERKDLVLLKKFETLFKNLQMNADICLNMN